MGGTELCATFCVSILVLIKQIIQFSTRIGILIIQGTTTFLVAVATGTGCNSLLENLQLLPINAHVNVWCVYKRTWTLNNWQHALLEDCNPEDKFSGAS